MVPVYLIRFVSHASGLLDPGALLLIMARLMFRSITRKQRLAAYGSELSRILFDVFAFSSGKEPRTYVPPGPVETFCTNILERELSKSLGVLSRHGGRNAFHRILELAQKSVPEKHDETGRKF